MKTAHQLDTVEFYTCLLLDVARACDCSIADVTRSREQVKRLYAAHGMKFFTKLLPELGKCLDKALATNTQLEFPLWCVMDAGGILDETDCMPNILRDAWRMIFDDTGNLRLTPSGDWCSYDVSKGPFAHDLSVLTEGISIRIVATCVRSLRQFLYAMYKYAIPYDPETTQKVLSEFEATEEELRAIPDSSFEGPIINTARRLISRLLCNFDHREITPRHGPGAVATGEKYNRKMKFSRLYTEVDKVYPYTGYFTLVNSDLDHLELRSLIQKDTSTAKVALVPKDSRGPRLISAEPLEMQWLQQGLGRKLSAFLERHRMTRGFVNFTDQAINQDLARLSSIDRTLVTLDMKEASDRVDLRLVKALFRDVPILEGLLALRSQETELPGGKRISLSKYAPMGSALCFPVEALCFWALSVSAMHHHGKIPLAKARRSVYVYGDDLIVPRDCYLSVLQCLPTVGLKFNDSKCCTEGFFRESCGCEAYFGFDVKPTRLRAVWSTSRQPAVLAAYASYCNSLRARGYITSADYISGKVEALWGPLPYISPEMGEELSKWLRESRQGLLPTPSYPCIGWVDVSATGYENAIRLKSRYNKRLQRTEHLVWGLLPVVRRFKQFPRQELFVVLASQQPRSKPGTYALHRRVSAKRCWVWLQ